jgi:hypothetical protein
MRRRRLKRLPKLRQQKLTRDKLLTKLGAARKEAPAAWRVSGSCPRPIKPSRQRDSAFA